MPYSFTLVSIFGLVGVAFVIAALLVARILRPHAPNAQKLQTYECGPLPSAPAWRQFPVRYYIYALLFVLFDVETAFLFPWAVAYRGYRVAGVIEALIFLVILVVGLAYAWRKDALKWE